MNTLGEKIQYYRKAKKLTQKELAEGICSQGLISKIEKGSISPDIQTLQQIVSKLDISINQLLESNSENNYFFSDENAIIQGLIDKREYKILEEYVHFDELELIDENELSTYSLWVKSLIQYYNYGKTEEAINLLKKCLNQDISTIFKIRLLNSLTNYYIDSSDFSNAKTISKDLSNYLDSNKFDYKTISKCLFTLALLENHLENYKESISILQKSTNILISEDSLYNLENHYALLAINFYRIEEFEQSKKYNEFSLFLANIKGNNVIFNICKNNMNVLNNVLIINTDSTSI